MRFDQRFCARTAVTAGLFAAAVSVFGPSPVHAQTTPATTEQGPVRRLSIDDAVATALEQNLDLQVQRFNPELQDLTTSQFRAAYTPNFVSQISTSDNTQPSTSILDSGGSNLATGITSGNSVFNFGVQSLTNWYGGSYDVRFNNTRSTTTNLLQTFSPQLNNVITASYTQPLLRNFKIDGTRQQLIVSQKNKEITDTQLKQSITQTTRNVRNAYYDLVGAIGNLAVQRQSLLLSQQSLKDNRARVEIGTMAPLDIVQAEAEVATREEAVILAEAAIERLMDSLRTLVYNPSSPDFWTARIEPTDTLTFVPVTVDAEGAIKTALTERTDLQNARKNLEINDVNIQYFRNQSLPDVTASVNYNARAIGGLQVRRAPDPSNGGLPTGDIISSAELSYFETLRSTLAGDFPGWNLQFNIAYPIGRSPQEAQLARARLQQTQGERQISSLELAVTAEVRDAARNVQTNARRVDATRSSRILAERRLEAEEKKYQAGMTQNFFVLQAQRDLSVARNNELLALVEYAKSVVNYGAVQTAQLFGQ